MPKVENSSAAKIKRYQSILWLLLQHGKTIFSRPPELELDILNLHESLSDVDSAKELTKQLEALGPTFIKLGQALSVRSDLLPQAYLDALSKLHDDVAEAPFSEIEKIIETELGTNQKNLFAQFSTKPIAVASLGQVYAAKLQDGREVVVKVQRSGVREEIIDDLDALQIAARFLEDYIETAERLGILQMLEEFRHSLLLELDYEQEAQNLQTINVCMKEYTNIVIPQPVNSYTTSRVLTMEMINGIKVTSLNGFKRLDIDTSNLASDLYKAYLDQILIHGFVHSDPHPGNIFITEDNQLALLDLGMCAHVDPVKRMALLKLLLAMNEGRGEEAADLMLEINTPLADHDKNRALRQIAALVAQTQHPVGVYRKTGRVILELARIAMDNQIRPAPELVILGRTFLYLDLILEKLDPEFNPVELLKNQVFRILKRQSKQRLRSGRILATSLELQDLLAKTPKRLNQLIDQLVQSRFKINIEAFDEDRLLKSFELIANRITAGLVLAALIIGAALLMNIKTSFTIFGYPVLALLLFVCAAFMGLVLVISVLFKKDN